MLRKFIGRLYRKYTEDGKWTGTIGLSYKMEESAYLLEIMLRTEDSIVTYDLNDLNCLFEKKFGRAYTVRQFRLMAEVLIKLEGLSTSNVHLFTDCTYRNGEITFVKGSHFRICRCLIIDGKDERPSPPEGRLFLPDSSESAREDGEEDGGISKAEFRRQLRLARKQ